MEQKIKKNYLQWLLVLRIDGGHAFLLLIS